jgi:hypothetical protein
MAEINNLFHRLDELSFSRLVTFNLLLTAAQTNPDFRYINWKKQLTIMLDLELTQYNTVMEVCLEKEINRSLCNPKCRSLYEIKIRKILMNIDKFIIQDNKILPESIELK